jgi:protein-S-isoprenylcysteine O-methyltransferase Ste14
MISNFYYLLLVYLACLATRTIYELFKKSGRVDLKNKYLFAAIFTAMCLLWVSWFSLCPEDPQRLDFPPLVHWFGAAFFLSGWILAVGALIQLKGLEDIDHLVTSGLFSRIRHPMYTGFVCWILGWSIYHGAVISFVAGLVGIANVCYWRGLEDRSLTVRYGEIFAQYRSKTWF